MLKKNKNKIYENKTPMARQRNTRRPRKLFSGASRQIPIESCSVPWNALRFPATISIAHLVAQHRPGPGPGPAPAPTHPPGTFLERICDTSGKRRAATAAKANGFLWIDIGRGQGNWVHFRSPSLHTPFSILCNRTLTIKTLLPSYKYYL